MLYLEAKIDSIYMSQYGCRFKGKYFIFGVIGVPVDFHYRNTLNYFWYLCTCCVIGASKVIIKKVLYKNKDLESLKKFSKLYKDYKI